MAGETGGTAGVEGTTGDTSPASSSDGMVAELLAAADAVAKKGLEMSIAGYDAQAASKHP